MPSVYTESNAWNSAKILDTNDPVLGGISGADNEPLKILADRTLYLKDRLYRYDDVEALTADTTIDDTYIGKMISCTVGSGDSNLTLTLDLLANFTLGAVLAIKATCASLKNITVKAATSQLIFLNSDYMDNEIFMHDGEALYLMRDSGYWTVIAYKGNFEMVGTPISGYVQLPGTLQRNGTQYSKDAYPRLWKWCNEKLTNGNQRTTEAFWSSDPDGLPRYRGLFALDTTTIRVPDDRGMFDRYLDSGRGLDTARLHNYAGGLEMDAIIEHYHKTNLNPNANSNAGWGKITTGNDAAEGTLPLYKSGGALDAADNGIGTSETRPKNVAKIPLIIF